VRGQGLDLLLGEDPVVKVSLAYGNERKTLSFTASGTSSFDVPLNADGSRDYAYEITWLPANGDPVTSGLQRTSDTELFIPRAKLPVTGELDIVVRGFAVDFAATPFVDVALNWIDGDRTERKAIVLSADAKNATCTFNIGDRTQRKYHYAITYNRADGTRVPGAQGDTDDPARSREEHLEPLDRRGTRLEGQAVVGAFAAAPVLEACLPCKASCVTQSATAAA